MTREKFLFVLLLLLVGFAFILYGEFEEDMAAAQERIAAGTRLDTDCGVLEYAERGEGVPVLMIHGAGGGFDQALLFGRELIDRGFRLIAVSRFGYLNTPLPDDASPQAQADAHACLLDALKLEQVSVVGGSAGAPSAVQLALRHPERVERLALLVPVLATPATAGQPAVSLDPETEALIELGLQSEFLYWITQRFFPALLIETVLGTPIAALQEADAEEQARVAEVLLHLLPLGPREVGIHADREMINTLELIALEQVATPTVLFSAGGDRFGTQRLARYAADTLPDARLIEFPDGGHLWVGHHRALVEELVDFLASP